jgi:addiction module HigA family antidote
MTADLFQEKNSRAARRIPRLGISLNRLNEIVLGKRAITADTALRLARWLKTSPQFWMRLQADWDLRRAMDRAAS